MFNKCKKVFKLLFIYCFLFSVVLCQNMYSSNPQLTDEAFALRLSLREAILSKNIGDTIFFGSFEQNDNYLDGKEPIEWVILHKNLEANTAILISKYILECLPFNGFAENVTWENCSLRRYMNTDMLVEMFDDNELASIIPTYLINSRNIFNDSYSGEPTTDFLFIPGIDEMAVFFTNDYFVGETRIAELLRPGANRVCYATPYAIKKGVRVLGSDKKYPGAGNYFLRTTGLNGHRIWSGSVYADYYQAYISEVGELKPNGTGINSIDDGIRPMVQVAY